MTVFWHCLAGAVTQAHQACSNCYSFLLIRQHCAEEDGRESLAFAARVPQVLHVLEQAIAAPHNDVPVAVLEGRVTGLSGLSVAISGMKDFTGLGDRVVIYGLDGRETDAEIVAFRQDTVIAIPFNSLEGIGSGCRVVFWLFDQKTTEIACRWCAGC